MKNVISKEHKVEIRDFFEWFDKYYIVCMACVSPMVIWLNFNGRGMQGLYEIYPVFKRVILAGFDPAVALGTNLTFPMWGYGWFLILTENKLLILCIQHVLALVCVCFFIKYIEQKELLSVMGARIFKFLLLISVPFYAFHSLRWPYSIAASLFLIALVFLHKAFEDSAQKNAWVKHIVISGLLFGVIFNFRSDFFMMPFGLSLLVLIFFCISSQRNRLGFVLKKIVLWLMIIYSCLFPWALFTHHVSGHACLTSTNTGHACFIGLGNDRTNIWGIEEHDGCPKMHALVDAAFGEKHTTLDYQADMLLKRTFFTYISDRPWDYLKKCLVTFKRSLTEGVYQGEFFYMHSYDKEENPYFKFNNRKIVYQIITCPKDILCNHKEDLFRVCMQRLSYVTGGLVIFFSYCLLLFSLYYAITTKNLFFLFICAALCYQTLMNILVHYKPGYTGNMYVLFVLNLTYALVQLYTSLCKQKSKIMKIK